MKPNITQHNGNGTNCRIKKKQQQQQPTIQSWMLVSAAPITQTTPTPPRIQRSLRKIIPSVGVLVLLLIRQLWLLPGWRQLVQHRLPLVPLVILNNNNNNNHPERLVGTPQPPVNSSRLDWRQQQHHHHHHDYSYDQQQQQQQQQPQQQQQQQQQPPKLLRTGASAVNNIRRRPSKGACGFDTVERSDEETDEFDVEDDDDPSMLWVSTLSKEEQDDYQQVWQCLQRVYYGGSDPPKQKNNNNNNNMAARFFKLACPEVVTAMRLRMMLIRHQIIWWIGSHHHHHHHYSSSSSTSGDIDHQSPRNSLRRLQFYSLACTMNPDLTREAFIEVKDEPLSSSSPFSSSNLIIFRYGIRTEFRLIESESDESAVRLLEQAMRNSTGYDLIVADAHTIVAAAAATTTSSAAAAAALALAVSSPGKGTILNRNSVNMLDTHVQHQAAAYLARMQQQTNATILFLEATALPCDFLSSRSSNTYILQSKSSPRDDDDHHHHHHQSANLPDRRINSFLRSVQRLRSNTSRSPLYNMLLVPLWHPMASYAANVSIDCSSPLNTTATATVSAVMAMNQQLVRALIQVYNRTPPRAKELTNEEKKEAQRVETCRKAHQRDKLERLTADAAARHHPHPKKDGCGLNDDDDTVPTWVPYTDHDFQLYQEIRECTKRIPTYKETEDPYEMHMLSRLRCQQEVTLDVTRSVLSRLERVWFIGDSVNRQQFEVLLCMVSPNLTTNELVFSQDDALSYATKNELSYHWKNGKSNTVFRYSPFGLIFDRTEGTLYRTAFPEAIRTSTDKDLIVVNAGHHYHSQDYDILREAATQIATQCTNATLVFMEAADEQWPTSNGIFATACSWACKCEPLSEQQVQGIGMPRNSGNKPIDFTVRDPRQLVMPSWVFDLYPNFTVSSPADCVPYCAPANWRNDVTRPILQQTEHSQVKIVPVWRQLVSQQKVHSLQLEGDCTHKPVPSLMTMNEQLVRSLLEEHKIVGG